MRNPLLSLFGSIIEKNVQQNEREATIELMIMTMYIDKSLKLTEEQTIHEYIKNTKWESPLSPEYYLGTAYAKVRTALKNKENTNIFLQDIKNRISNPQTKSQILKGCHQLANSDGELSPEEKDFLANVTKIFEVSAM